MSVWVKAILIFALPASLVACDNALEFTRKPRSTPYNKHESGLTFPYTGNIDIFTQPVYDKNTVSVDFQVFDLSGESITTLTKADITLIENSQDVMNFTFRKKSAASSSADIVFVIDVTGSMEQEVKSVKQKVSEFVDKLESEKILANLCLVTFKDSVRRKCVNFTVDDPNTPQNENLVEFRDEVSKISVRAGDGGDNPENQLAAIISAANDTPWTPMSQRVAILITDAGFHTKDNPGDAGAEAPDYIEAINAIKNSNLNVYAVAPRLPGYASDYDGMESLVVAGKGKFYDILETIEREETDVFSDTGTRVLTTKPSIGDILDDIANNLSALYTVEYVVDENQNLDVSLPLGQRHVQIAINLPGDLILRPPVSSMPLGRPHYYKQWTLAQDYDPELSTYKVFINGIPQDTGFIIQDGKIIFDEAPAPGSSINVAYEFGNLRDNIKIEPIIVTPKYDFYVVIVLLNGVEAPAEDYKVEDTVDGKIMVEPSENVFYDHDPYGIRKYGGLEIMVIVEERDFPEAEILDDAESGGE